MTEGINTDAAPGPTRARHPARATRAATPFAGLPMAQVALRFARARHTGQRREIDHTAFIAHPIAQVVESVSDDPSAGDYKSRKNDLRERVARADPGTRAVFAADKIAKAHEFSVLPRQQLNEPENRAKLAHYRASLETLRRADRDMPLTHRLDVELERLVARSGRLRRSSPSHA